MSGKQLNVIRILPPQIPQFWDIVKHTAHLMYPEGVTEAALVDVLHSLLSDKAQLWLALNEERKVIIVCMTAIINDVYTNKKVLHLKNLYSYERGSDWIDAFSSVLEFAKKNGCEAITSNSFGGPALAVAEKVGMRKSFTRYILEI